MLTRFRFILIISALTLLYLFGFRGYYIPAFNPPYMNEYYDHSQWVVPQSVRVMGDEGRYEVAAYRLLRGGDLYEVASEVPSAGKYLFGVSQLLFGRSLVAVVLVFGLTVFGFYLLSGEFFGDAKKRYLATILFVMVPNVAISLSRVTLDLMQVCALIFHMYFVLRCMRDKDTSSWYWCLIAGLCSGLFVSVKFGLFFVPVMFADLVIFYLHKRLKYFVVMCGVPALVYIASTLQFFVTGGDLSGWIGAQKWIAKFYMDSNTGFIPGMSFLTMVTSLYKGWWQEGWEFSEDWSVALTLGLGMLGYYVVRLLRKRERVSSSWGYLVVYSVTTVLLLAVIAFWPRYLLLVTPFFVLLLVKFISDFSIKPIFVYIFCGVLAVQSTGLFFVQPHKFVGQYDKLYEQALFQDLFFALADKKPYESEVFFWKRMLDIQREMGAYSRSIEIQERFVWPWENRVSFPTKVAYATDIGKIEHEYNLQLVREDGLWKVEWAWEYVLPGFSEDGSVLKERRDGTEGVLKLSSGEVLSHGGHRIFIHASPAAVTNFDEMENMLTPILGLGDKRYIVTKKLKENAPAESMVAFGFARYDASIADIAHVCQHSAVWCAELSDRMVTESFIRDGYLDRIVALEKKYADQLRPKHGGLIRLNDREIYSREVVNGQDVTVSDDDWRNAGQ